MASDIRKRKVSPEKEEEPLPAKAPSLDCPISATALMPAARLSASFFARPLLDVAADLLGKRLSVRDASGVRSGLIVETEAYAGSSDPAAHSYRKKTARNASMFGPPGTLYVYSIYGCYHCVNVSSTGDGCAVLLRALVPESGLEAMRAGRANPKTGKVPAKDSELCNGPSKMCQALGITKAQDGIDTCSEAAAVWFEDAKWCVPRSEVVRCARIGIEGAGAEAAAKPFRFYVRANPFVSKRDKRAETAMLQSASSDQ